MMPLPSVTCPDCGLPMILRQTAKYRYGNGDPRRFWGCTSFPACKAIHGAHPDGRPFGIPGDAATKAARVRAHAAFDQLWKGKTMTRADAYAMLGDIMEMSRDEAHIGRLTAEQCETLIVRLAEWWAEVTS